MIETIMLVSYIIFAILIMAIVYELNSVLKLLPDGLSSIFLPILVIGGILFFLLCVFYSSYKQAYDEEIKDAKDQYSKYKNKTETFYADQLKATWLNAMNGKNKYFIYSFMIYTFIPFFMYVGYLLTQPIGLKTSLDVWMEKNGVSFAVSSFILMNAITLFSFIFANKLALLYIVIPVLFTCFAAITFQHMNLLSVQSIFSNGITLLVSVITFLLMVYMELGILLEWNAYFMLPAEIMFSIIIGLLFMITLPK